MKKILKISLLILIFLLIVYYPNSTYAKSEIVKIDFSDKKFYSMIVEKLGEKILNKNDDDYVIEVEKDEIQQITELTFEANTLSVWELDNINGIENFTGLKKLEFYNYKLDDITALKSLTNLEELKLYNAQITSIQELKDLVNLKELDLQKNKIKDIEPIKSMTKLIKLNLSDNEIEDIKYIENLKELTGLDLSSNKIRDISSLQSLTKLTLPNKSYDENIIPLYLIKLINFEHLYLDDNQISNISVLNKDILKYTTAQKQEFSINTNKKELSINNSFLQNKELELTNCKISDDKSKIMFDGTNNDIIIKVVNGIFNESIVKINYDINEPSLMINYSETEATNNPVVVTISSSEEIRPVDGWDLSENKNRLTKTYSKNKTEQIKVYDISGNESIADITVKNIDIPILTTTYSVINDLSLLKGEKIIEEADKYVGKVPYVLQGDSLTDGIDCSHFVYRILQKCGLYDGKYIRSTNWINEGEPVENLENAIAGDVIVWDGHVAFYDGYGKIVEAKGKKWGLTHDRDAAKAIEKKTYLGIRRFTGNEKSETIINQNEPTDKDIKVTINSNKRIKSVNGWKLSNNEKVLTKKYTKNMNEVVKIKDYDGNEVEVNINITNINK